MLAKTKYQEITTFPTMFTIPPAMLEYAESMKHQNNKVNTPKQFQKNTPTNARNIIYAQQMMAQASECVGIDYHKCDYVFFSAKNGSVEHVDDLDHKKYGIITYLLPLILPSSGNTFYTPNDSVELEMGNIYRFDHSKPHGLDVNDNGGCVMVMFSCLTY